MLKYEFKWVPAGYYSIELAIQDCDGKGAKETDLDSFMMYAMAE